MMHCKVVFCNQRIFRALPAALGPLAVKEQRRSRRTNEAVAMRGGSIAIERIGDGDPFDFEVRITTPPPASCLIANRRNRFCGVSTSRSSHAIFPNSSRCCRAISTRRERRGTSLLTQDLPP
jgi:hypothetical protein